MDAGYGAEEQASRRARRAAERRRDLAANEAVGSAAEAELERLLREQRMWAQGAEGERQVASALEPLAQFGWLAAHDLHWPGRPFANIDHIAVGPGGVFVIDAKNWTGNVTISNGLLRQNGYSRERELESVAQAAAAVTALLAPQHRASVRAVICLAAQEQEPVTVGPGVTVVGRHQLAAWLVTLPARLTPYDVADLGRHFQRTLTRVGDAPAGGHAGTRGRAARKGRGSATAARGARGQQRRPAGRGSAARRRRKARAAIIEAVVRLVLVLLFLLFVTSVVLPRAYGGG